ncbi:prolyl 4-hydroxylase subunit alpha-1 [Procambarus clarkii]|uniref:prolyl 4-hydroxylase subunit alpha-1 n=1 Tax=Procambarus clarkii TaxID=6728 RepID=UPI0037429674
MYGRAAEWFAAAREVAREVARDASDDSHASGEEQIVNSERQIQQLSVLLDLAISVHDHQLTKGNQERMGNYPLPLYQTPAEVQKARWEEEDDDDDAVLQLEESDSLPATTTDRRASARLCLGHTLMSERERSRLRCRVDARGSWWLTLMPAKVEEHSLQPLILSFHHVLSQRQLVILRHLARPLLQAAKVQGFEEDLTFAYRSSYLAWLHGDVHPVVRAANRMIAALTGLEMAEEKGEAEMLQANLYGAGGHYVLHMDFLALYRTLWEADEPDQKLMKQFPNGDRIATFMFYMNEVEEGGRTVFPRVGVGVEPEAGSAVFWYNLSPTGKGDHRTLHSACPVLRGTKWVSNKWIKYYPQLHHKPCLPLVK